MLNGRSPGVTPHGGGGGGGGGGNPSKKKTARKRGFPQKRGGGGITLQNEQRSVRGASPQIVGGGGHTGIFSTFSHSNFSLFSVGFWIILILNKILIHNYIYSKT